MITLRTCFPREEQTTVDRRRDLARELAKFMPDYHSSLWSVPYPVSEPEGTYVIDQNNNWWCKVDDEDSQVIRVHFRHAHERPEVERDFARWVLACRQDWSIESSDQPETKTEEQ